MASPLVVEHRTTIDVPATVVFACYRAVEKWSEWDPDTLMASLEGEFRVGARGRLRPRQGREVPMEIVAVEPDRSFTAEVRIPMFVMRFEHEISPAGGAVMVTHRVGFEGLLSRLIGPRLAARVDAGLPATLASLKQYLERR